MGKAVIDADFFIKMTTREPDGLLFMKVMKDLGIEPVMHEYVAYTELKENSTAQQMLSEGKIAVLKYSDYITDRNKGEYEEYFLEAYERMNQFDFPDADIYTYEEKDENLGEIRSLYLAKCMKYLYFMSDDSGARIFANNYFTSKNRVEVCNVYDAFVKCKVNGTDLTWKKINPTATNALRSNRSKLDAIKKLYAA